MVGGWVKVEERELRKIAKKFEMHDLLEKLDRWDKNRTSFIVRGGRRYPATPYTEGAYKIIAKKEGYEVIVTAKHCLSHSATSRDEEFELGAKGIVEQERPQEYKQKVSF